MPARLEVHAEGDAGSPAAPAARATSTTTVPCGLGRFTGDLPHEYVCARHSAKRLPGFLDRSIWKYDRPDERPSRRGVMRLISYVTDWDMRAAVLVGESLA
jgi:hypothetical protein